MVGRRCVFLDRDGVINVKQPDDVYVTCWQELNLSLKLSIGFVY